MPTRGFGVNVELKVDKKRKKEFADEIKESIGKLDIGDKLTVTNKSLDSLKASIKNAVAPSVSSAFSKAISEGVKNLKLEIDNVKIKKFDSKSALADVRAELEKMFNALSLKSGVNVTAIKDFMDSSGDENAVRSAQQATAQRKAYADAMKKEIGVMEAMYSKYSIGGSKELDTTALENYKRVLQELRDEYNLLLSGAIDLANYDHAAWTKKAADAQLAAKAARDVIEANMAMQNAAKNQPKTGAQVMREEAVASFNNTWKKFTQTMATADVNDHVAAIGQSMNDLYDSVNRAGSTLDANDIAAATSQMNDRLDERSQAVANLRKQEKDLANTRASLTKKNIALSASDEKLYTDYQAAHENQSVAGMSITEINARADEAANIKAQYDGVASSFIKTTDATNMLSNALRKLDAAYKSAGKNNTDRWKPTTDNDGNVVPPTYTAVDGTTVGGSLNELYNQQRANLTKMINQTGTYNKVAVEGMVQQADELTNLIKLNTQEYATNQQRATLQKQYQDLLKSNSRIRGTGMQVSIDNAVSELGDKSIKMTADRFKELQTELSKSRVRMRELGLEGKSFADTVKNAYARFGGWSLVTKSLSMVFRSFRKMIQNVVELDTAMTELYKVTDETADTYSRFFDDAAVRAKKYGATLTDTITATADFARLGYSLEDAAVLADTAIVYKAVGDNIDSISTASESIISTMKAFGIEAENAMQIVDKFNITGNNFAISSKGVGDALVRSASALSTAGNSIDESIALITAMNTTLQDAERVGTTMKTLTMFLRASKAELEEVGESTEGMATSVSKLREQIMALTNNRVDIMLDDDTYKSTYAIIQDIAGVWDKMSDIDRAALLELLGGKRNANAITSLIENFQIAEDVIEKTTNSAGSALEENAKYLESINGKLAQMKAAAEELSASLFNSDFFGVLVDGATVFISGLEKIVDLLGSLPTLMTAFTATMTLTNTKTLLSPFSKNGGMHYTFNALNNGNGFWGNTKALFRENGWGMLGYFNNKARNDFVAMDMYDNAVTNAAISSGIDAKDIDAMNAFRMSAEDTKKTLDGLDNMMSTEMRAHLDDLNGGLSRTSGKMIEVSSWAKELRTNFFKMGAAVAANIGWTLLITMAIKGLSLLIDKAFETRKEMREAAEEIRSSYDDAIGSIKDGISTVKSLKAEFGTLSLGVDDNGNNINLSEDEYERYRNIVDDIVALTPALIQGYDAEGHAIVDKNELIEKSIELLEKQRRLENEKLVSKDNLEALTKDAKLDIDEAKTGYGTKRMEAVSELAKAFDGMDSHGVDFVNRNFYERIAPDQNAFERYGTDIEAFLTDYYDSAVAALKNGDQTLKNLLADGVDYSELILSTESYARELAILDGDIATATKSLNSTLQLVAPTVDGYDALDATVKQFVTDYVNGMALTSAASNEAGYTMAQSIRNLTNGLVNERTGTITSLKEFIGELYAMPEEIAALSASEYEAQARKLIDNINLVMKRLGRELTDEQKYDLLLNVGITTTDEKYGDGSTSAITKMVDDIRAYFGYDDLELNFSYADLVNAHKIIMELDDGQNITFADLIYRMEVLGNTAEDVASNAENLKNTLEGLNASLAVITDVEAELLQYGSLTGETIASLLEDKASYLDLLYEENGAIKMNTDALIAQKRIAAQTDIDDRRAKIDQLIGQRTIDEDQLAYWTNVRDKALSDYGSLHTAENYQRYSTAADEVAKYEEAIENANSDIATHNKYISILEASLRDFEDNVTGIKKAMSDMSSAISGMEDLYSIIENSGKATFDEATSLVQTYGHEILKGATVAADGTMRLNAEVLNEFLKMKQEEVKASIESEKQKLETQKAVLRAQIEQINMQLEMARVQKALRNGDVSEEEARAYADSVATKIAMQEMLTAAFKESNLDQQTIAEMTALAMTEDWEQFSNLAKTAVSALDGDSATAFGSMMENFRTAASNMIDNSEQLVNAFNAVAAAYNGIGKEDGGNVKAQGKAIFGGTLSPADYENEVIDILSDFKNNFDLTSSIEGAGKTASDINKAWADTKSKYSGVISSIANDLMHSMLATNIDVDSLEQQKAQLEGAIQSLDLEIASLDISFDAYKAYKPKGSGSGSNKDIVIDDLHEVKQRIKEINAEMEQINTQIEMLELEDFEGYQKQAENLQDLIGYTKEYNDLLHIQAEGNRAKIAENIVKLNSAGFEVSYNLDENQFAVKNIQLLNDMSEELKEKYNELIENTVELNDENIELSQSWWDNTNSIKGYKDQMIDLLDTMVEVHQESVDQIQDLYDTLREAAQNYAKTGYMSLDSFQAIIDMGVEYLAMLEDENGELVINEENIKDVMKARSEQLAVETALAYVERLRLALEEGKADEVQRLLSGTKELTDSTWGLVYANLALLDLDYDQYTKALTNINRLRSLSSSITYDTDDELSAMEDGLSSILDYVMDMVKWENEEMVEALEKQLEKYEEIIEKKKEAIELDKEEADYTQELADKIKDISKLQTEIDRLGLDDSRESQAKKKELEEELAEKQKELADFQAEYSVEKQQDALDKELEAFEKKNEAEIEATEDLVSSQEKIYRLA